ncbi:MAG: hypothetical protein ACTHNM_17210 [Dyella sp.]|uniref:hypothetical protein n=1 Tax=Dyella sp. TaxID=1869338 RepID=UPI003F7F06BC
MYANEPKRHVRVRANRRSIAAGRDITFHPGAHVVLGDFHQYSHRCAHCRRLSPSVSRARYRRLLCCLVCVVIGLYVSVLMPMSPRDTVAECVMTGLWGYVFPQPLWAWAEMRMRHRQRAPSHRAGL